MNDVGSLLIWLAAMAVLSLLDAVARRRRQPSGEEVAQSEAERAGPVSERPKPVPDREAQPGPPEPVVWESEWRELRPRPEEVDASPDEEDAIPPDRPPLIAAAEEIRERARLDLAAVARPLAARPTEPAGIERPIRPGPSGSPRRDRGRALHALFRGDGNALRTAVLYREVLGPPLGARRGPGGWEDPDPPSTSGTAARSRP